MILPQLSAETPRPTDPRRRCLLKGHAMYASRYPRCADLVALLLPHQACREEQRGWHRPCKALSNSVCAFGRRIALTTVLCFFVLQPTQRLLWPKLLRLLAPAASGSSKSSPCTVGVSKSSRVFSAASSFLLCLRVTFSADALVFVAFRMARARWCDHGFPCHLCDLQVQRRQLRVFRADFLEESYEQRMGSHHGAMLFFHPRRITKTKESSK